MTTEELLKSNPELFTTVTSRSEEGILHTDEVTPLEKKEVVINEEITPKA